MHVSSLNKSKEAHLEREVYQLKGQLKWAIQASHSIMKNLGSLEELLDALEKEDLFFAKQVWFEISEKDQDNLMIAYSKGGAFEAKDREIVARLWRDK